MLDMLDEKYGLFSEGRKAFLMPDGDEIVASAIKIGDQIFTGVTHYEASEKARAAGAWDYTDENRGYKEGKRAYSGEERGAVYFDGFVGKSGKFYTRDETWKGTGQE
jgi:hypothetical protein